MGYNGWRGSAGLDTLCRPSSMYEWVFEGGSAVRDILVKSGWWIAQSPDDVYEGARVSCEKPPPPSALDCDRNVKPCLFDVFEDPCEYHDLADQYPNVSKDFRICFLLFNQK